MYGAIGGLKTEPADSIPWVQLSDEPVDVAAFLENNQSAGASGRYDAQVGVSSPSF